MRAWLVCILLASAATWGAEYPSKPIRVITGTAAGSGADAEARAFATQLAARLGQPVVVENRPGNTGQIALEAVARAAPDGYTLGVAQGAALVIHPQLNPLTAFDAQRDLVPLALLSKHPIVLYASAATPFSSVADLVSAARANPGGVTFASSGVGTVGHLSGEWFRRLAGVELTHVPYAAKSPAADLLGGHVDAMFYPPIGMVSNVQQGRIRALATSGKARLAAMPDVQTFAEAGFAGFEAYAWAAAVAPRGLPAAIVARLEAACTDAISGAAYRDYIAGLGGTAIGGTSAEAAQFIRDDRARWKAVIDATGLKAP